ncbi:MAG: hypothetical protein M3N17_01235 [Actinomycetota bacterium]|nr:hypothetical protein [Actinomycetota bacterium]
MRLRRRRPPAHGSEDGEFCRLCGQYMAIDEDGRCVLGHVVTAPAEDSPPVDAAAPEDHDDLPLASEATGTEAAPAGRGQPASSTGAEPRGALEELLSWDAPTAQEPPGDEPSGASDAAPADGPADDEGDETTADGDEGDETRDEEDPAPWTASGHHVGMLLAGALLSLAMFGVTVVLGALA